jgi:hypothetical protein
MKYWIGLTLFLVGCSGSDHFLEKTADPPPRYGKNYQFDLNQSEKGGGDVDILWVIDNSGSMGSYQANVINNLDAFMTAFAPSSTLHWRMGLISTSLYEQPYMGFDSVVDWTTPDSGKVFADAMSKLGTGGDSNEQSFAPTLNALAQYPTFLRPGAFFVQVIVSDELEDEGRRSNVSPTSYLSQIHQLMHADDRFAVFGIFLAGGSNNWSNNSYDDVVKATGGSEYDIEATNYNDLLTKLGHDLVARTSTIDPVIVLDRRPKPETILVKYKGRELRPGPAIAGGEWTYDPEYNLIRLNNPSLINSTQRDVNVSFEVADGAPVGP